MYLRKVKAHPFDMESNDIDVGLILDKKEKAVHPSAVKLLQTSDKIHPETTLVELVRAIKKRLPPKTMLPRQWEDFRNQFDECDADSKKTFNDFLSMLQRESFYRDTLAEALIFKQSSVRLTYSNEIKFLTQEQQKNQNEMGGALHQSIAGGDNAAASGKSGGDLAGGAVQPSFSYLIVDLIIFPFQGAQMLLTTNDQGTCQLFDCETGVLQHEFVFNQSFSSKKQRSSDASRKAAHLRKTATNTATASAENNEESVVNMSIDEAATAAHESSLNLVTMNAVNKMGAGKPNQSGVISDSNSIQHLGYTSYESNSGSVDHASKVVNSKKGGAQIQIRKSNNSSLAITKQTSIVSSSFKQQQQQKKAQADIINDKSFDIVGNDATHVIIEEDIVEENYNTNSNSRLRKPPRVGGSRNVTAAAGTASKILNKTGGNFDSQSSAGQRKASVVSGSRNNMKLTRMISQDHRLSFKNSQTQSFQSQAQLDSKRRQTSYISRRPGNNLNNTMNAHGTTASAVAPSEYASVSGANNNTMMLRSARTRIADQRRQKIKDFDSRSKEMIRKHGHNQKITQKLGLDCHIFEQEEFDATYPSQGNKNNNNNASLTLDKINADTVGLDSNTSAARSQTAKNALSKSYTYQSTQNAAGTTGASQSTSASKRKKEFKQIDAWNEIPHQIDAYKARKEPIPFGMSEKIWDLDSYKDNFKLFKAEFNRIEEEYNKGEKRLEEIRAIKSGMGTHEQSGVERGSLIGGRERARLKHQDSSTSFTSAIGQKKTFQKSSDLSKQQQQSSKQYQQQQQLLQHSERRGSQESGFMPKAATAAAAAPSSLQSRNKTPNYDSTTVYHTMKTVNHQHHGGNKSAERRAYVPMKNRQKNELVAKMRPMERFRREMFLLHEHPDALKDITQGIREDQKIIAQTLQNNQLLVRVLEKQRDRNSKWLDALRDEERKDPKDQRLPEIECIDFERYEETFEEKQGYNEYNYLDFYKPKDLSIGEIMKNYVTRADKDAKETVRKLAPKTLKPSQPMFMTFYKKCNLVVFALLGEVKIIQVKQNGQKKTFHTVASFVLESLPVAMDIGSHKLTGKLLVFVAQQTFKGDKLKKSKESNDEKCYISVIEVDQHNGFAVHEKTRIFPDRPQITRLLYKKNYGLIMACYRGYIEHFDGNNFKSVKKWSNNMKAIGSDKQKAKVAILENKRKDQENFDDWIADELTKRAIVTGGPGMPNKQSSAAGIGSDVTFNNSKSNKSASRKRLSVKQIKEEQGRAKREEAERKKAELRVHTLKALKKNKKDKIQVQTINCIDYSEDLYLIAFGGVHGQIGVLDSTTMSFIGMFDAHANVEVSAIYFYKKERQMISVSLEGDCALWDAQKMTILQTIRRPQDQVQKQKHISTSTFDQISSQLFMTTSEVFRYTLQEDLETKIQIDHQLTVAANYLQQTKEAVDRRSKYSTEGGGSKQSLDQYPDAETGADSQDEEVKASKLPVAAAGLSRQQTRVSDIKKKTTEKKTESSLPNGSQIVYDILNYKKLPQMEMTKSAVPRTFDRGSFSVLPSSKTRLIGCFFNVPSARMFTIDIDCLVRQWDLTTGLCIRSYPLEKPSAAGDQSSMDNNLSNFKCRHNIQTLKLSPDGRALAVAFQTGLIQVNNIYSGSVLYNKAIENMIDLGPEITDLAFFHKQTNYWIAATLWEGKVAFLQRPLKDKGGDIIREKKVDSMHSRDVLCLDITEANHMATASIDNTIIFWNMYNAREGKRVVVPESMSCGSTIQAIRFAIRDSNDFLFVFMSSGEIYVLETQSETYLEPQDFDEHKIINEYSFGKAPKFATFHIAEKENESGIANASQLYILAVEESGKEGNLHMATIMDPVEARRRENKHGSRIKRRYKHKKTFTVTDVNIKFYLPKCTQAANQNTAVIKAELLPKLGMFVISQASGVVGFYDIRTCELLTYMNEGSWSPSIQQIMRQQVSNLKVNDAFADSDDECESNEMINQRQNRKPSDDSASGQHLLNDEIDCHNTETTNQQQKLLISPLSQGESNHHLVNKMPHTAKNNQAAHTMATPLSMAGGAQQQQETMVFSAKLTQENSSKRNNNLGETTRTKNSTHAPTSAGMTSPK